MPGIIIIIPSRYGSTRLKGKPLIKIAGKPMIQHVYEQSQKADGISDVIVATDDKRIFDTIIGFGGNVRMTSGKHRSGTDRIAEVAKGLKAEIIVNVQGDEPLVKPRMIEELVSPLINGDVVMSTLKCKIKNKEDIKNPNIVKVVTDLEDNALYFSRSIIPHSIDCKNIYKHIGLYAYKKDFLIKFSQMSPSNLEKIESLEQLRVLENGWKIKVIETQNPSQGVDTLDDVRRVTSLIEGR
jgi:3-deoxy-manno-octulosonate cytidylyltransferase (CMP-KDO synthetase)|tara:strand:- start:1061 stop:1780 length:720 start_codon:yes stop_codon:yes gene_type:complete